MLRGKIKGTEKNQKQKIIEKGCVGFEDEHKCLIEQNQHTLSH